MPRDFFRKNWLWDVAAAIVVVLLSPFLILLFLWLAKIIGISDEFLEFLRLLQPPYILLFIFVLVVLRTFSRQISRLIDRIKTLPGGADFYEQRPADEAAPNKDESGVKTEMGKSVPIGGSLAEIQKKAKEGDAESQNNLGRCYYNGEGVARDEAKAVKWFRLAAKQGLAKARHNLGVCYANGKGITRDEEEAMKWFRQSAEQGFAPAQFNLGVCYAKGDGVKRNQKEAVEWCAKAAEQGFAPAQYNLGRCYANGSGVTQDYAEAVKWFHLAAKQGNAAAQGNLGIAYHNGNGVPQSPWEAYVWHSIAAANGIRESEKFRDDDARLLSAEDLARAQAEAVRRTEDIRKWNAKKK